MTVGRGLYVLTALDQISRRQGELARGLCRRLRGEPGIRVFNDPERVLRRFELLDELWRRNRNEFRAVRAAADWTGVRYPVFVRSDRSHQGALSPLLRTPAEVEASIGRALVHGHRLGDLLVVEFCETADREGYYRKYAAFAVGDRVIARNLEYGRRWMLKHAGTEFSRKMVLEERDYVFANPHELELAEIFRLARVEYGRIDYSVKDGRIQTWEINLNPTIGRGRGPSRARVPPELAPIREEMKECFFRRFEEAWDAADPSPDGLPPLEVTLPRPSISFDRFRQGPRGRIRRDGDRDAPAGPALLTPLASRAFPLVARIARRARRS